MYAKCLLFALAAGLVLRRGGGENSAGAVQDEHHRHAHDVDPREPHTHWRELLPIPTRFQLADASRPSREKN